MDAGIEEDFINVGMSDGTEDGLVDQRNVDLLATILIHDFPEFLKSEFRREDLDSLLQESRNSGVISCFRQIDLAHFLVVEVVETTAIVE